MSTPENTSRRDPLVHLAGAWDSSERYITGMEAAGQEQMVAGTTLPTELNFSSEDEFIALGFILGDVVPGDPMFREATLPDGWRREGSEHNMWSYIVDERGVQRVSVFYKAAFYDRRAFMSLVNVGGQVATEWIYGDGDTPALNPALTAAELSDARASAERYLTDAEAYPSRQERAPRARALIEAIENTSGRGA